MFVNPTVVDFRSYFIRDFPYGTTIDTVMDQDILNAITDAASNFNPGLFGDQGTYTTCYLNLSAHFLVMSLRASSQGIAGQYEWLVSSKGVGSVSEGLAIPPRIMDNPEFAMLTKTPYGAKYLFMVLPLLAGNIVSVCGGTNY